MRFVELLTPSLSYKQYNVYLNAFAFYKPCYKLWKHIYLVQWKIIQLHLIYSELLLDFLLYSQIIIFINEHKSWNFHKFFHFLLKICSENYATEELG